MAIRESPDGTSSRRSLKTAMLALLASTRWALGLTWSTSPWLVSGVVISTCGRALVPAGLALTARGLINGWSISYTVGPMTSRY